MTMIRDLPAAFLAVLSVCASLVSAQPVITHPAANVAIHQRLEQVKFTFYRQQNPGQMARVKARYLAVQLAAGKKILWEIRAPLNRGAWEIAYGEVPEGFGQSVPAADLPPPLVIGTDYTVSVILDVGIVHWQTFTYLGE